MGKDVQPLKSVKTSILAMLTIKSGLEGSIVYAMRLIMLTLDHVINGLFMLP